jgi:hypothetical protein
MDTSVSVELFVEILNRYVYYFDQQNETVSSAQINRTFSQVLIDFGAGHNEILEWTYRAHPFEPFYQPGRQPRGPRKSETTLLSDVRIHQEQGV